MTEMADMHFMYGLADGSMREANCLYQEWFPGQEHVQQDSSAFQRQWSICIEPNRPRKAVIREYC